MPWKRSSKFRDFRRENCVNGHKYPNMMMPANFELLSAIWDPRPHDGEPNAVVGTRYPLWGVLSGGNVSVKLAAPNPPFINDDGVIEIHTEKARNET
jgi:hypothetical protein